MLRTRIVFLASALVALLVLPELALGQGYSPPGGGEEGGSELAFTGRDLYLWGGLGLLLVGVGLGLRRLTMPDAEDRDAPERASADPVAARPALAEPAYPPPTGAPVAAEPPVGVAEPAATAGIPAGVEPTAPVGIDALSGASAERAVIAPIVGDLRRERRPAREERGRDRGPVPVPVVRPREGGRAAVEHGVAQALVGAAGERDLLEIAASHIAGALNASSGAVLVREDAGQPVVVARAGDVDEDVARLDGAAVAALREGRVVRGATPSGRYELAAPIQVDGRVWGAVAAGSDMSFTEADASLAGALAAQTAEALTAVWAVQDSGGDVFAARRVAGATAEPGERRLAEYRAVARLAMTVGGQLGVPASRLKTLYVAGLFHDLGMAGVPREIASRAPRLSEEERRLVEQHPLTGARLMRQSPQLRDAADIVRFLGEHYDGTGIPEGLAGEQIPLESRILAACVAWVALTSDRPGHPAADPQDAALVLRAARGTQFDPSVVDAVLEASPAAAPAPAPA